MATSITPRLPQQLDITTAPTPEPSTWAMLLGGIALLGFVIRRRSFNS